MNISKKNCFSLALIFLSLSPTHLFSAAHEAQHDEAQELANQIKTWIKFNSHAGNDDYRNFLEHQCGAHNPYLQRAKLVNPDGTRLPHVEVLRAVSGLPFGPNKITIRPNNFPPRRR